MIIMVCGHFMRMIFCVVNVMNLVTLKNFLSLDVFLYHLLIVIMNSMICVKNVSSGIWMKCGTMNKVNGLKWNVMDVMKNTFQMVLLFKLKEKVKILVYLDLTLMKIKPHQMNLTQVVHFGTIKNSLNSILYLHSVLNVRMNIGWMYRMTCTIVFDMKSVIIIVHRANGSCLTVNVKLIVSSLDQNKMQIGNLVPYYVLVLTVTDGLYTLKTNHKKKLLKPKC